MSIPIGAARLFQGDALKIMPTLARASIGAVLADPPYCSGGDVRGRDRPTSAKYQSKEQHGLYPEFGGDSRDQRSYLAWSTLWMSEAHELMRPGGLILVFTDWRQLPVTTDAIQAAGFVWRGIVPWDKTASARPQLGRYRNQAEYGVWATKGRRPLQGPVAPGVITHPAPSRKLHIAGKPVALMGDLLRIMEGPVLDPFMGSGTVGVACAQRGLEYVGIEMEPAYFEIARRRLEGQLEAG